jgi:hypothetical protein
VNVFALLASQPFACTDINQPCWLQDFQDELATLNLQLNMAEARTDRLQKENQELVDRWMARMGKEADAMNNASKFS